jgi:transposase
MEESWRSSVHRSFAQAAFLQDGRIKREQRVDLVHDRLVKFGKTLSVEDEIVIEATGNSAAVERVLRPLVKRVVIANPRMVRAIAYARVKTDKIDADLGQTSRRRFSSRSLGRG